MARVKMAWGILVSALAWGPWALAQDLEPRGMLPVAGSVPSRNNSTQAANGQGVQPTAAVLAAAPAPAGAADGVVRPPDATIVDDSMTALPAGGEACPRDAGGCQRPSFWGRCKERLKACFIGYGEEFAAPPLGHFVYLHAQTEVANGDAARMMLYHYDFDDGGVRLNPRGRDQLAKIEAMLPRNFFPIVVQRTPGAPQLAEARRALVLDELAHGSFPIPPERVVIGPPIAPGLRGADAETIYKNYIKQIEEAGRPIKPTYEGGTGQARVSPLVQ